MLPMTRVFSARRAADHCERRLVPGRTASPLRGGLVAGALAVLLAGCGARMPELQQSDPAQAMPVAELDRAAGLYRDDSGRPLLLTPSARGGLSLFVAEGFAWDSSSRIARQIRSGPDGWTVQLDAEPPRPLQVEERGGIVVALAWSGADSRYRVMRDASPRYRVRALRFDSDVDLAGTVFLPDAPQPVPGAVLIHGSGNSDRDNLWYVLVARALAEGGIAVLLPDKRGSGLSRGDWRDAGFDALAQDALAAHAQLRAQPGVDPGRVGLVGLSQGGWIAPLAATRSPQVAFAVSLVGAAVTPREQTTHEIRQQLRESGVPDWLAPAVMPWASRRPAKRLPEWWAKNGDFDPIPLWRALDRPALVVFGAEDERDNVPVERSVQRLQALGKPASALQVLVIPGVGHGLIERDELSAQVRTRLVDWIHAVR